MSNQFPPTRQLVEVSSSLAKQKNYNLIKTESCKTQNVVIMFWQQLKRIHMVINKKSIQTGS